MSYSHHAVADVVLMGCDIISLAWWSWRFGNPSGYIFNGEGENSS